MSTPSLRPQLARAAEILVRDYLAVTAGETVLITMDDAGDRTAVDAIVNSAKNIGAKPGIYITPQLPFQGALADPYINESLAAVVKACDMWIDLTFPYIAGSAAYEDAMTSNRARYFLGGDMRSESLVRLFGRADLDLMFDVHETFNALLTPGKECRIANDAGTDITFKLTAPPFPKPRQADKAGLYLVPGNVPMWPDCDSVKGTIVISAAFHEYYTVLPTPIALTIDGQIREVTGGDNERRVLDRALKRAGGGIYGQVIHFSYGYHPGARFTGCCFVEDTRTAGNNACGLGLPFWQPGGGENHPDGVIKMQSIWVDGEQLVDDGAMVGPPQLAALGARHIARQPGEETMALVDVGEFVPGDGLDRTRLPLERARHAPGYVYGTPQSLTLEKERLFMRDWLYVGRAEEFAQAGDYRTFRILDEPVVSPAMPTANSTPSSTSARIAASRLPRVTVTPGISAAPITAGYTT